MERIYGEDLTALRRAWEELIATQRVTESQRVQALEWLLRPSVFGKPCAHATAVARRRAWRLEGNGDVAEAFAAWRSICGSTAADADDVAEAWRVALLAGRFDEARRLARSVLSRDDAGRVLQGEAEVAIGDAALLESDVATAAAAYARAAQSPVSGWRARMLAIKQTICGWPAGAARTAVARAVVLGEEESAPTGGLEELQAVVAAIPGAPVPRYVLARQLFARGRFEDVLNLLHVPAAEPLPTLDLEHDERRLVAEATFRVGDYGSARALFESLARDAAEPSEERYAADWRDRCEFAATYRP